MYCDFAIDRIRFWAFCSFLGCLLLAANAHANEYFVSPAGNDSSSGSAASPFRTIQRGIDQAVAGDTVTVRAGVYRGNAHFYQSGASGAPIILRAFPGERPIIDPSGAGYPVVIEAEPWQNRLPCGYIEVRGFELRNGGDGLALTNAHHVVIEDNWIHDNANQGILGEGHDLIIRRNKIYSNGNATSTLYHGIYLTGRRVLIANNLIYSNSSYGLQIAAYGCGGHCAGSDFSGAVDWTIAHNVFALEQNRSGIVVWMPDASYGDQAGTDLRNLTIANNIFFDNNADNPSSANGIDFYDTAGDSTMEVSHNLFFSSWQAPEMASNLGPIRANVTNNVNGRDPLFVNSGLRDFAIQAGSPARDSGRILPQVVDDFIGVARPQGAAYDMGAYEFSAGMVPPSPCDVNGDRTLDARDVQLCVNQAIDIMTCTTGDINRDTRCNVIDVQRVVYAFLGGACLTQ